MNHLPRFAEPTERMIDFRGFEREFVADEVRIPLRGTDNLQIILARVEFTVMGDDDGELIMPMAVTVTDFDGAQDVIRVDPFHPRSFGPWPTMADAIASEVSWWLHKVWIDVEAWAREEVQ